MTDDCQPSRELASAYLDNELSVSESLAVEKHLRQCADCAREVAALAALSAKVKQQAHYYGAKTALVDRVRSATAPAPAMGYASQAQRRNFFSGWLPAGGAALMVLLLAGAALWYFAGKNAETELAKAILSSHIRSTLSQQPFDVASADRHTVKPWFHGKLNFAPPVIDLSAQGFDLQGGRLDFVDGRTVPVIVFGRRKHVINLFVWPNPGQANRAPSQSNANGYNLVQWQLDGMRLWVISDLAAGELVEFTRQFTSQLIRESPNS